MALCYNYLTFGDIYTYRQNEISLIELNYFGI